MEPEFGSEGNIRWGVEATPCYEDGTPIPDDDRRCACGNVGSTCVMGKDAHMWVCSKCLYDNEHNQMGWCSKHNIVVKPNEKCPACVAGLEKPEPIIDDSWLVNMRVTEDE